MIEKKALATQWHIGFLGAYIVAVAGLLGYYLWVNIPRLVATSPGRTPPANFDLSLFLVVMAMGALGGLIHTANSFTTYVGEGKFVKSWTLWYFFRPIIGALLSVIFYVVFRGGLMTTAAATSASMNVYGILALAGLVGMFSDKATAKLKEIFDAAFVTKDDRTDKLSDEVSDQTDQTTSNGAATTDKKKLLQSAAQADTPHDHADASSLETMISGASSQQASAAASPSGHDSVSRRALLQKAAEAETSSSDEAETLTKQMNPSVQ